MSAQPRPFPGAGHRRLVALSLDTHLPPLSAFTPTKDIRYHPLFQGMLFPWVWRVWTQRFTRAGHYFAAATLFFVAFGSVSLNQQFYVPFAYALGLWAAAFVGMQLGRPRVLLSATTPDRGRAGETLAVEVEVRARGRRGLGLSVLPDRLPPEIDAVPEGGAALPALAPGEAARARLGLRCTRRGVYTLRGFRAETAFPFGLLVAQRVFPEARQLLVHPRWTPLARMETPRGRRYLPGGVTSGSALGDSFEFVGSREYRAGDPVRAIDWRATARLSRPVVREYREELLQRAALILDIHAPSPPGLPAPPAFESAVSLAAAAADYLARAEFSVDLLAAGPALHPLAAGPDALLDLLAGVEPGTQDWEALQESLEEYLSGITLLVCVLLDWDAAREAFVDRLRGYGPGVKVVIVREASPTLPPGDLTVLTPAQVDAGAGEI